MFTVLQPRQVCPAAFKSCFSWFERKFFVFLQMFTTWNNISDWFIADEKGKQKFSNVYCWRHFSSHSFYLRSFFIDTQTIYQAMVVNCSAAGIFVYTAIESSKRSLRMRITDEDPLHGLNGGVYKAPVFSTNKIGINRKQKMVHLRFYYWNINESYFNSKLCE